MSAPRPAPAPCVDERGDVTVSDRAVRRIVRQVAAEVLGSAGTAREARVARVGERAAHIRMGLELAYPADLVGHGVRVRRQLMDRASELSGVDITRADIVIEGLRTVPVTPVDLRAVRDGGLGSAQLVPSATRADSEVPRAVAAAPLGHRPWSARRLSAAAVSLVVAATAGALLVRIARDGPGAWGGLRGVPLSDGRWTAAGVVTALLGVVLMVLAATPGYRRRLPMAPPDGATLATLDRAALASLLGQAVLPVEGVRSVRVRIGRLRVRIRVRVASPGSSDVRGGSVVRAASAVLDGAGLLRSPRVSVKVVADERGRPSGEREVAG
ncbi:DUF6286 domain-containing protein [Streptomyces sp. NPDC015130]|uniref:DUF6286 domain-containing protein n=1 Tax=Streptomyces sp. NPDC015130 TaxID=3364940 RepID=UPI003700BFC2